MHILGQLSPRTAARQQIASLFGGQGSSLTSQDILKRARERTVEKGQSPYAADQIQEPIILTPNMSMGTIQQLLRATKISQRICFVTTQSEVKAVADLGHHHQAIIVRGETPEQRLMHVHRIATDLSLYGNPDISFTNRSDKSPLPLDPPKLFEVMRNIRQTSNHNAQSAVPTGEQLSLLN